jgi:hypothetical protein
MRSAGTKGHRRQGTSQVGKLTSIALRAPIDGAARMPRHDDAQPATTPLGFGIVSESTRQDVIYKIPEETPGYGEASAFAISQIDKIMDEAVKSGANRIILNTNLKRGLPMENINKIAGPLIEAWAFETFYDVLDNSPSQYSLVNVEAQARLGIADVILQFAPQKPEWGGITAEVDVKATAEDIVKSGKSPNITSYARIRSAYVEEPDYIFLILSLKHRVYSVRNSVSSLMDGVMEVVRHNTYDLKYISESDLTYNPALGTGQLQVRDIHYVSLVKRSSWEFCQMLDEKFLRSTRRDREQWFIMAMSHGWVK